MSGKMTCGVCGRRLERSEMRLGVVVPMWFDDDAAGAKTEPYACGTSVDICNDCYDKVAVVHGRHADGTAEFRPFPGTEGFVGRAAALADARERDDGFWLEIIQNEDGSLSRERILKELHDYGTLLKNVPIAYLHVTGELASHPFTRPEVVCALANDRTDEIVKTELEQLGLGE